MRSWSACGCGRGGCRCPRCEFTTKARYDTRGVPSTWRHLDLAARRLRIRADLRRLCCPVHGVITQGVPFARPGSRFTRDFEDLVGWLATTMDKTALARLVRVDWDTTGRIIERVVADRLDPDRLQHLFQVGVDEVSWRKGHSYLTLVSNHEPGSSCGAARARTRPPWTTSSTTWARTEPRRYKRCRWTCRPRSGKA